MTLNCSPWTSQFFITAVAVRRVFWFFSFFGWAASTKNIILKFRFLFDDIVMITTEGPATFRIGFHKHTKKSDYFSCFDRCSASAYESSELVTLWKESLVRCDEKWKLFLFHRISLAVASFSANLLLLMTLIIIYFNIFNEKQDRHRAAKFTEFVCSVARRRATTGH